MHDRQSVLEVANVLSGISEIVAVKFGERSGGNFFNCLDNFKYSFTFVGDGFSLWLSIFEIRIYPQIKRGSVIFFNRSGMSDTRFLDKLDVYLLDN